MASSSSSKAGESYIGSLISITSKYEIRYEGFLYHINSQDSTIGLKDVRSYGTEGRKKDGPQIPPSDKVYECILFRGSDIKDLQVRSPPPAQTEEQIYNDPAIIQNHSALSSSTAVGVQAQHTPALTTKAHSGALPSFQPANHVVLKNLSLATQNAGPSLSMPMHSQGYHGITSQQSMVSSPLIVQNPMQVFGSQESPFMGLKSPSECITPESTVAANPLNPNFSSSLPLVQYAISPDTSSFFSLKTPTPSHATSLPVHRLTMSSIPVSSQDINTTKTLAVADPMAMHPAQSMPYLMPSYVGSTSSSVLTPSPSLLSPHHFLQSRPPVLSSQQKLYSDQKDVAVLTPLSSTSPPLLSTPASQPPLLPLPGSVQQHKYLTSQFTEEFDFEAMNEKFKKDEVWGYLGKAKQREKIEGMEDNTTDQSMVDKEALAVVPNLDPKPAYKKDEFFDSISCNIRTQRWNGQNCFSERMKLDTETFGNLHLRPNLGHRGLGSGRGDTYHTSRGRGRGYGYGAMGDLFLLISSGVDELQSEQLSVSADRSILPIIFIVIPDGLSWNVICEIALLDT
ncbi:DECAPPING 5-LIKE PROTEIN-RELATED [Salix viminalis]|uniref:DECAPPING 5-LIKE PROTEIN-RELATED n=1 Tax=Salix viminalis TaxID=40686 RepID=A0A9Q0TPW3_SALVM|nr:DECAPPING 5-LIKE PROTEIN-RELATED [Salix viminalis]